MPDLLQIGSITDEMYTRLSAAFTIHQSDDFEAEKITHVVTNGHDGIAPALMAQLPNLKAISCYGVSSSLGRGTVALAYVADRVQ